MDIKRPFSEENLLWDFPFQPAPFKISLIGYPHRSSPIMKLLSEAFGNRLSIMWMKPHGTKLASLKASFFMIHSKRPSATFEELIKYWKGILVLSVTITAFTKKWVVLVAIS